MSWGWSFQPYVSAAEKRRRSEKAAAKLAKSGRRDLQPIRIESTKIASSFWGKSWCQNLESYSDYANRLPRGRTYVRNGSVLDLQISAGAVEALVSGSSLYRVSITIRTIQASVWKALKSECSGQVGSLIDLLQGKLSAPVMQIMTRRESGLFPRSGEIEFDCSCPDSAGLCKHIAAVLYGIGARLDEMPELLFVLRRADHLELISAAAESVKAGAKAPAANTIAADALADVFGIEIDSSAVAPPAPAPKPMATRAKRHPAAAAKARKTPPSKKVKKAKKPASGAHSRKPPRREKPKAR